MTIIAKTLAVLLLPATISLAHADSSQNCIVEGTVKTKRPSNTVPTSMLRFTVPVTEQVAIAAI